MGVFVRVEDVDDGEFTEREDEPVGSLSAAELVEIGINLFSRTTEIDGLT